MTANSHTGCHPDPAMQGKLEESQISLVFARHEANLLNTVNR